MALVHILPLQIALTRFGAAAFVSYPKSPFPL